MLFGLIDQKWSLANVTQVQKIMIHNNLFHHVCFVFAIIDLKCFAWCNVIQQIKHRFTILCKWSFVFGEIQRISWNPADFMWNPLDFMWISPKYLINQLFQQEIFSLMNAGRGAMTQDFTKSISFHEILGHSPPAPQN